MSLREEIPTEPPRPGFEEELGLVVETPIHLAYPTSMTTPNSIATVPLPSAVPSIPNHVFITQRTVELDDVTAESP